MKDRMKVLIAYDGSVCAGEALADLRRAGLPREAQATIVTVSEVWLPPPSAYEMVANASVGSSNNSVFTQRAAVVQVTQARAFALEAKARLQSYFPAWEIGVEELVGSPVREILKKADELKPNLIILGSQGHTGLGGFLLGSVSHKVVNEAHCSVRVARGTVWKDGAPMRILLGLDGSQAAEAAVQAVVARVWPQASEARIIAVVDPSAAAILNQTILTGADLISSEQSAKPAWVTEFVEAASRKLRAAELIVSSKIEEGCPKHLLIADAEEWGAECIFIGASSTQSSIKEMLLGSVATAVVVRARCSVEVVRT